jgi:acetoin utilization deacetylase AcuC-like enzyme
MPAASRTMHDRPPPPPRARRIFIDGFVAARLGVDPRTNARHAPMVYHDGYSCPDWPVGHTFPMAKFEQTARSLLNDADDSAMSDEDRDDVVDDIDDNRAEIVGEGDGRLVLSEDHFFVPMDMEAFPMSFLCPPIRSDFLERFLSGSLSTEECRVIGFREHTSRPELIERTVLEVAGTVLTAQLAMRYGLASNLAGGTHHAESGRGKGYTIINDLAVTARLMTWGVGADVDDGCDGTTAPDVEMLREFYRGDDHRVVDRVLVVDCDVHQGDGTATFSGPPEGADVADGREHSLRGRLFTLDLHAENNYPHPKEKCTYDVGLPDDCDDEAYLLKLTESLDRALTEVRPQLVLYNAGVDVHVSDKLGRLSLSLDGMRRRDTHVVRTCVDRNIPVAVVVGGGYDDDVIALGMRHAIVHRVCAQIWREGQMWRRSFAGGEDVSTE